MSSWVASAHEFDICFDVEADTAEEVAKKYFERQIPGCCESAETPGSCYVLLVESEEEAFTSVIHHAVDADLMIEALDQAQSDRCCGELGWPFMADSKENAPHREELEKTVIAAVEKFLKATGDAPPNSGIWRQALKTYTVSKNEDGTLSWEPPLEQD